VHLIRGIRALGLGPPSTVSSDAAEEQSVVVLIDLDFKVCGCVVPYNERTLPMLTTKPPKPPEDVLERARKLVPLTLANASRGELAVLAKIAAGSRTEWDGTSVGDGTPMGGTDSTLEKYLLDEGVTVDRDGRTQVHGVPLIDPFEVPTHQKEKFKPSVPGTKKKLISASTRRRDVLQNAETIASWNKALIFALRARVVECSEVNGKPISEDALIEERTNIIAILKAIVAISTRTKEVAVTEGDARRVRACKARDKALDLVEKLFAARSIARAEKIIVDVEQDRLRLLPALTSPDFAVRNTIALLRLFSDWPLQSLARCKHSECRRYFVPGAVGYTRSVGQEYCHPYCSRRAKEQRSAQRS
jgi:hypothetical protein